MANFSTYLEKAVLNHVFRNTAYTQPATVYVGLADDVATDAEMEAGTLTNEITGYTGNRPAVTFSAPVDDGAGAEKILNTANIEFTNMPAVTVKYAFVSDSATKGAGNLLMWCPLATPKAVGAGDTFRLPADTGLTLKLA